VSDQPATPQPRININVPDEVRHGMYANFLVVGHTAHEFTLDFCQLQPGQDGQVGAEVVSRVRIAPTMVARTMQALNSNLTNYEERFGSVRAIQ
jgi:hypothetical protein